SDERTESTRRSRKIYLEGLAGRVGLAVSILRFYAVFTKSFNSLFYSLLLFFWKMLVVVVAFTEGFCSHPVMFKYVRSDAVGLKAIYLPRLGVSALQFQLHQERGIGIFIDKRFRLC